MPRVKGTRRSEIRKLCVNGYIAALLLILTVASAVVLGTTENAEALDRVLYHQQAPGNGPFGIWVMNIDGTNKTQLTSPSSGYGDINPSLSPDGIHVAYCRLNPTGVDELRIVNVNGTGDALILSANVFNCQVTWTPDGNALVYPREMGMCSVDFYKVNIDGTNDVLFYDGAEIYSGRFLPDGSKFVWAEEGGCGSPTAEIYIAPYSGGVLNAAAKQRLTNNSVLDFDPQISPDGTKVLFTRSEAANGYDSPHNVYVMNIDGSNQTKLGNASGAYSSFSPKWSPTGTEIVYTYDGAPAGIHNIWKMNADGSNMVQLTNNSTNTGGAYWFWQSTLTDGLVAYYPFNGNANDESGNGHTGTINGATLTTDRFGNAGAAYFFNGTSDYITLANTDQMNFEIGGFSLAAWVNFASDNFDEGIIGKHICGESSGYFLGVGSLGGGGKNSFEFYLSGDPRLVTSTKYSDGNWHFVVSIYDGNTQSLYVDGLLKISQAIPYTSFNNADISIGRIGQNCIYTFDGYFNGAIDDIRIYNRALALPEIQSLYTAGGWESPLVVADGLIAYYPFSGNANDRGGYGYHGTVYGAALTLDRFGNANSAYSFNGINNYISVSADPVFDFGMNDFSISLWVNFNDFTGEQVLIEKCSGQCGSGSFTKLNDTNFLYSGGTSIVPLDIMLNTWSHIVVTRNIDNFRIYLNGSHISTTATSGANFTSSNPLLIGRRNPDDGRNFFMNGLLDDIRIYNRALLIDEIQQLYLEGYQSIFVTKTGTGTGAVTSTPAGIDCGATCSSPYTSGAVVTLTATPDAGSTFMGWTGDLDCADGVVTMDAARYCFATFAADTTPPTGTILINNNDVATASTAVTLNLTCSDGRAPYTSDVNTVLLDHFDGSTGASINAYNQNGQACGSSLPSVTPNYSFGTGMAGFDQALTLIRPSGMPAGSATYLQYPGGQLLSQANGTIDFWVKLPNWNIGLLQQGPFFGSCAGWTFGMSVNASGQLTASAWAAFDMNSGATTMPLNEWTHVAASWGSTGAKLYINGVMVGSVANTGMPASGYGGSLLVNLVDQGGASVGIDELRVSNIQRTTFPTETGSGCSEMKFSNDNISWSAPEPFFASTAWTLTSGSGTKTVYAMFKDNSGNWSPASSDTITLNAGYSLTVNKSGTGTGAVTVDYGVLTWAGNTGTGSYASGTVVTLTATPDAGSYFNGWTGDPDCVDGVVTMDAARTCSANFLLNTYPLNVSKSGTGSGKITSLPAGIDCGADCTENYDYNAVVTLSATPDAGSYFNGWTGNPDCADGSVTINALTYCTANFDLLPTVNFADYFYFNTTSALSYITTSGDTNSINKVYMTRFIGTETINSTVTSRLGVVPDGITPEPYINMVNTGTAVQLWGNGEVQLDQPVTYTSHSDGDILTFSAINATNRADQSVVSITPSPKLVDIRDVTVFGTVYTNALLLFTVDTSYSPIPINFGTNTLGFPAVYMPNSNGPLPGALTHIEVYGLGTGRIADIDIDAVTGNPINIIELQAILDNPLVGKWGNVMLKHRNAGAWHTRAGGFTFNNDGTGVEDYVNNDNGTVASGSVSFTYTWSVNNDGSITVNYVYPTSTPTRRYVISDSGRSMLQDGTDDLTEQRFRMFGRMDGTGYSNADLNGDYYMLGYGHDTAPVTPPSGNGAFMTISSITSFNGTGLYSYSGRANSDGTIWDDSGSGNTYSVGSDGFFSVNTSGIGGIGKDRKSMLISSSASNEFIAYAAMKKGDRTYSTADVAGTWALSGFGDDNNTRFQSALGTATCDVTGLCNVALRNQDSGEVSYTLKQLTFSVAPDGSFGSSFGAEYPAYAGAIGSDAGMMLMNISLGTTTGNNRTMIVGIRCSTCSDIEGQYYTLTVNSSGAGSGTVSTDMGNMDWNGAAGIAAFAPGTVVTLTATPDTGSAFTGWSGDADCSDGIVTMSTAVNCTATFDISDTTAPETTIDSSPAASTTSTSATFTFSSSESGSTFECSIDSGAWEACTSPKDYTSLSENSHTFEVRATDTADNTDATPASYTWTVDLTAPDTTITAAPSNPTNATTASFSFTSTESGSSFQCKRDAQAWAACTSPRNYTALAAGSHTVSIRATDAAGNTDATPATYTWSVDTTAPTLSIGSPSATLTKSGPVTFTVTYTGADSVTLADGNISLNTTGTATGTASVSGTGTATRTVTISGITGDGTIGISIVTGTASDTAGNTAAAAGASSTFTVDNTAPVVNAGADQSKNAQFTQTATATDAGSMTYAWTKQSGTGTITFGTASALSTTVSASASGTYVLRFTATDAAGNSAYDDMTLTYVIDSVDPTVVITAPADNSTRNKILSISGTAADAAPSSGLDYVDIQVYQLDVDGTPYYLQADNSWDITEQWLRATTSTSWASWSKNTSLVVWSSDTWYTITAKAVDKSGNSATTTHHAYIYSGAAVATDLTLATSSQSILLDEMIDVSGKLTRLPDIGVDLSGLTIQIDIVDPDGITRSPVVTTTTNTPEGHYVLTGISGFTKAGVYTIKATFAGNTYLAKSTSAEQSVIVGASAGYAIIVEGKVSSNDGLDSHNKTTNRVYRTLKDRGFLDKDIYYINYQGTGQPAGIIIDDPTPTKLDVKNAIQTWAKTRLNAMPAPIYIVMVDHGSPETFWMGSETITPTELGSWLDTLETGLSTEARAKERVIIIGTCYSGSFIPSLAKAGRVIITSAADDEPSYKGPKENDGIRSGEFFIEELFKHLGKGYSLTDSFIEATEKTEDFTPKGGNSQNSPIYQDASAQHPMIEDDGLVPYGSNVLSNGSGDGVMADAIYLGIGETNDVASPAEFISVTPTKFLTATQSSATFWGEVTDNSFVSSAWIEIRSLATAITGQTGTGQLELNTVKVPMTKNNSTGKWEATYSSFTASGMYEIYYFTQQTGTLELTPMKRSVVYKNKTGNYAPTAFDLVSPGDATEQETVLMLDWSDSTDPDGITYTVEVSRDPTFATKDFVREEIVSSSTVLGPEAKLEDLTTYYWRVYAIDKYGAKKKSTSTRSFNTNNTNGLPAFISGYITDIETGNGIGGVTITSSKGGSTQTFSDGYFILTLTPNTMTLTVKKTGYTDATSESFSVGSADSIIKNFNLVTSTPPDTVIGSGPSKPTKALSATFAFTSTKSYSTFECMLDGSVWTACASPKIYTGLAAGSHTFKVRATDYASNTDLTPATWTWSVDTTVPTLGTVSPTPVTTEQGKPQNFTAVYSDADGFSNLKTVEMLVNSTLTVIDAVRVSYDNTTNKLSLYDDPGTNAMGTCTPGAAVVTISNSKGTLNCQQTTVTKAGNSITVKWNITPKLAFASTTVKKLALKATDKAGNTTAWIQKGAWTIIAANTAPTLGALTHSPTSTSAGTAHALTAVYTDADGFANIRSAELLVTSAATGGAGSVWAKYDLGLNKLYLYNDTGTAVLATSCAPGAAGTLTNSQGNLNCAGTTVTKAGNNITVKWSITPKPVYTGAKNLKMRAIDNSSATTGLLSKGTWTITAAAPSSESSEAFRVITYGFADSLPYTEMSDQALAVDDSQNNIVVTAEPVSEIGNGSVSIGVRKTSASMTAADLSGTYIVAEYSDRVASVSEYLFDGAGTVLITGKSATDDETPKQAAVPYEVSEDGSLGIANLNGQITEDGQVVVLVSGSQGEMPALLIGVKKGNATELSGAYEGAEIRSSNAGEEIVATSADGETICRGCIVTEDGRIVIQADTDRTDASVRSGIRLLIRKR